VEQVELLKFSVEALERLVVPYAIIGSFASSIWGEARFTQDIDILINLPPNRISNLCDSFPGADFFVSPAAARAAAENYGQFNVIHPASGNKIDFMVAGQNAWTSRELDRKLDIELFPGCLTAVASPDDVILGKLIYFREGGSDKHLRDIASILKISNHLVDRSYIAKTAIDLGVDDIWRLVTSQIAGD
jgi:hypothetical protein